MRKVMDNREPGYFAHEEPALQLEFFRKRAGFSQKALSILLDIDINTVKAFENGTQRPEDMELVMKIAHLLRVSTDELLGKTITTDTPSNMLKI